MRILLVVPALLLTACPPKPAGEQLPPAGLAGAPGTGSPTALPGAGIPVPAPSGTADPTTTLPPGHPAIPGAKVADDGSGSLPPGHPPIDGAGPTGAPPMMGGPSMGGGVENVTLTGSVLEAIDVPEYTYMRIKTAGGEDWVAVTKVPVKVGDVVTVNQSLVMTDFPSKSLNRTFPKLIMGSLVGTPKKKP